MKLMRQMDAWMEGIDETMCEWRNEPLVNQWVIDGVNESIANWWMNELRNYMLAAAALFWSLAEWTIHARIKQLLLALFIPAAFINSFIDSLPFINSLINFIRIHSPSFAQQFVSQMNPYIDSLFIPLVANSFTH